MERVCFLTQLKALGLEDFFQNCRKLFEMSGHDNIDDLKERIGEHTFLLEYDTEERLIGAGIPKESILYVSRMLRKMFRRNRKIDCEITETSKLRKMVRRNRKIDREIDRKITETSIYVYKPWRISRSSHRGD